MIKDFKIGVRLSFGLGFVFIVFIVVNLFMINRMNFLSDLTRLMFMHPLTVSNAVLRIDGNIIRIHRSMKDVALAKNEDEIKSASKIVDNFEVLINRDFDIVAERFLGKKEMYERARDAFMQWKPIRNEVITLMHKNRKDDAAAITKGKGAKHVEKLNVAMLSLNNFAQDKAKSFLNHSLKIKSQTLKIAYIIVFATIVLISFFMLILIRGITKPLARLMNFVKEISLGNLKMKVNIISNDEIGMLAASFNDMAEKLQESYMGLEKKVQDRTDKLNRTNEALLDEIKERKQAEEKLIDSLKEKGILLAEIHHRVKNNFQIITSILNHQKNKIKDENILDVLNVSQNRIKSMSLVHEKLYVSENFAYINLIDYIKALILELCQTYIKNSKIIEFKYNDHDIKLNINQAIPCGMILNELISNSFKYAFKGDFKGEEKVIIEVNLEDKEIILTISDNGIGLPGDLDLEKLETLGLKLLPLFVKQLKGEYKMELKNGTKYIIKFKNIEE